MKKYTQVEEEVEKKKSQKTFIVFSSIASSCSYLFDPDDIPTPLMLLICIPFPLIRVNIHTSVHSLDAVQLEQHSKHTGNAGTEFGPSSYTDDLSIGTYFKVI